MDNPQFQTGSRLFWGEPFDILIIITLLRYNSRTSKTLHKRTTCNNELPKKTCAFALLHVTHTRKQFTLWYEVRSDEASATLSFTQLSSANVSPPHLVSSPSIFPSVFSCRFPFLSISVYLVPSLSTTPLEDFPCNDIPVWIYSPRCPK